jgi:hypothetical protein
MAIPARLKHNTSRDLAVIAVRVLDDAHMTWVAAEVDSGYALRAWFDAGAPQDADAYLVYRAALLRRTHKIGIAPSIGDISTRSLPPSLEQ